jgi:hypothetical protein
MTSPDFLKFTMRFDPTDDDRARHVEDMVIDRAGIRPKKGLRADIIRHLFEIAEGNELILEQLAKRINEAA